MSDFAVTTLFVVPSGTLASTGSTQDLTPNQLGLFGPDYAIVTAGTIAAADYFFIAQGRPATAFPELGSKQSDRIRKANVLDWYKTVAEPDSNGEVFEISGFKVQCDEVLNVTIRIHSTIVEAIAFNGFTRTVYAQAPCCDCGEAPCAQITAAETQAMVDEIVNKINAPATSPDGSSQFVLSTFVTAARSGTGYDSKLILRGKPLPTYSNPWQPFSNMPDSDRMWFRAFAYTGPALSNEYTVEDACEVTAVGVVTQRATLPSGSSLEVKKLEYDYYSYQTSRMKHLHKDWGFNQGFQTAVVDGTWYDLYYLTAEEIDDYGWQPKLHQKFRVIVAFPTGGASTAFETALTAALGAPKNKSGVNITTTTSTSSSSTTTTTTTIIVP